MYAYKVAVKYGVNTNEETKQKVIHTRKGRVLFCSSSEGRCQAFDGMCLFNLYRRSFQLLSQSCLILWCSRFLINCVKYSLLQDSGGRLSEF